MNVCVSSSLLIFQSSGRVCHTPDIERSPSVALATAGNSWKQASAAEGARDSGGCADGKDAADGACSLEARRRSRQGGDRVITGSGEGGGAFLVPYLAACRCQATAAAPSRRPSAWNRRSRDPRSPAGREPPDRRGASARRPWSLHRTAAVERNTSISIGVAMETAHKSAPDFPFQFWLHYCSNPWDASTLDFICCCVYLIRPNVLVAICYITEVSLMTELLQPS